MVSNQRILLIAAAPLEFSGLRAFCSEEERLEWPVHWARSVRLNGSRLFLVANGAGPLRARQAAEVAHASESVEAMVSMGFCGGLDPALRAGEVFIASEIRSGGRIFPVSMPRTRFSSARGVLESVDRVVQCIEEKARLWALGAEAVEMEAAAVAERAAEWNVPFFCVKAVTDEADESFGLDYNAALSSDGRFMTSRILSAALKRPQVGFPELIRLGRRCRAASRSLGEFLSDCRL